MAKKPKTRTAPKKHMRSKPISFRLDNSLIEHLDHAAKRVHTTRNRLVANVLKDYVVDRGAAEMARIAEREAENGKIDLFA